MSGPVIGGRFISGDLCRVILDEVDRNAWWQWSQIDSDGYTGVQLGFRRGTWCEVPRRCRRVVAGRLLAIGVGLRRQFGDFRGFEGPNLLRYGDGDFFRAHQDERSGRAWFRRRSVTIVAFLNDTGFAGGVLRLHGVDRGRVLDLRPRAGTFVAFPAETYHEVSPIHGGDRYTIVAWLYR
ncbi:MAG TPA: 2OG-Fe(II) oxygenase [Kofleriaceae bacterium]|jgi:hypothetical protein|nr:2OG-Fe(II) oxygenase [Kofleriaceae bacterium]